MEKETKKPTKGTWDRLGNEDMPRTDRISFDINIPVEVIFDGDSPQEKAGEEPDTVYYEFAVWRDSLPQVIQTSAWTLLGELKKLYPLHGKRVRITKKMEKGRQYFEVVKL